jgi:hypothetical protein
MFRRSTKLFKGQTKPRHRARRLTRIAALCGDWLYAVPILRLNSEVMREAVGLRTMSGTCGVEVDAREFQALRCKPNAGSARRRHYINDLVWCAVTSVEELLRHLPNQTGKRPDGLTLIPRREGRSRDLLRSQVIRI